MSGMQDELRRSCQIPRFIIYNALLVGALLGEESLHHLSRGMFLDHGVLRAIGVSARETREGFDTVRNKGKNKPFCADSVRYAVSRVARTEVISAFDDCVSLLAQAGFLRKLKTYVIDGTEIIVDGDYEGAGSLTKTKRVIAAGGEIREELTTKKGFKLVTLGGLSDVGPLIVGARYQQIQHSELKAADALMKEWGPRMKKGDLLLLDRGFFSGDQLGRWRREYGVDFVIPLRKDLDVRADMIQLAKMGAGTRAVRGGKTKRPELVVEGFSHLLSLSSYPGELRGILVTTYKGEPVPPEKQWGFITTLPANTERQVLAIYDAYDQRSKIENQGYRELKQGFCLPRFFGKDARSQYFHVFFTLLMYNMVAAFKSKHADRFLGMSPKIIVYAGCYYAVFEILELMNLLGRPPTGDIDDKRIRYLTNVKKTPLSS